MAQVWTRVHLALARLWGDRHGATAVEYAVVIAGIAIAVMAVLAEIGTDLKGHFQDVNRPLSG